MKDVWYRYEFEDGTIEIVRGFSKRELAHKMLRHGKVVRKIRES